MQEELITFETAKLAKEKGFNEYCQYVHDTFNNIEEWEYGDEKHKNSYENASVYYSAPIQSLLQRWLREVHNIFVSVDVNYCYEIYYNDELFKESICYHSYEEALEVGLQEALKLIKL